MAKKDYVYWVPDERYKKGFFHYRQNLIALLENTYSMHGYKDSAIPTTNNIIYLTELLFMMLRGRDIPVEIPREWEK